MGYIIRSGFSVRLADGSIHIGGEEVELTAEEFAANKHKLEGTQTSDDIVDWRNNNSSVENNNPDEDLAEIISQLELKVENIKSFPHYSFWVSGLEIVYVGQTRGSSGRVYLSSGVYVQYDNLDKLNPKWTIYQIAEQDLSLAESNKNYLYLKDGMLQYSLEFPKVEELKERLYIGALFRSSQDSPPIKPSKFLIEGTPESIRLLNSNDGVENISLNILPSPGNMNLRHDTGIMKIIGQNFFNNSADPHSVEVKPLSESAVISFAYADPTGNQTGANRGILDFSQYWNGQTLVTTGGKDDAVALFLYFCPDLSPALDGNQNTTYYQSWLMVFGNRQYNSLNTAKERWRSEEGAHVKPDYFGRSVLVAVILGRKDATDSANLNQVAIIPINPPYQVNYTPAATTFNDPNEIRSIG